MQNQAFYRTGIFGNFFLAGGNFAFSKREFSVALLQVSASINLKLNRANTVEITFRDRKRKQQNPPMLPDIL